MCLVFLILSIFFINNNNVANKCYNEKNLVVGTENDSFSLPDLDFETDPQNLGQNSGQKEINELNVLLNIVEDNYKKLKNKDGITINITKEQINGTKEKTKLDNIKTVLNDLNVTINNRLKNEEGKPSDPTDTNSKNPVDSENPVSSKNPVEHESKLIPPSSTIPPPPPPPPPPAVPVIPKK